LHKQGKPDYLARLRQSFKDGKPIIESLADLIEGKPVRRRIIVEYDLENEEDCFSDPKNIGYFLLDALYDALGICDVLSKHKFEIEENDEDMLDEAGAVVREGLRKRGPSKEKRAEPIVQMGLFIDDNGIPIAYRLFPGNNIDQTTLRPALKKSIDKLNFGKVIIVADGGLNSDKNIAHILSEGNGYILAKSTKKSAKSVNEWILDESDYEWNENRTFKVKSKVRKRTIKDENGEKVEITEKLICYWSKKHYDREVKENAKFIEYLESVIHFPDKLKDKPRKIEKFLKKMEIDKGTGEIVDTKTHLSVDMDKIQEYMALLGYYTIMTSETDKSDRVLWVTLFGTKTQ